MELGRGVESRHVKEHRGLHVITELARLDSHALHRVREPAAGALAVHPLLPEAGDELLEIGAPELVLAAEGKLLPAEIRQYVPAVLGHGPYVGDGCRAVVAVH